jgi:mono/diheme cytochrome c family protein
LNGRQIESNPLRSAEWNRGAYLVEGLSHCGACHSPRNWLGAEIENDAYRGATYLDEVAEGMIRPWTAVNLTSSNTGLGPWSVDDLAKYLKTGHSQRAGTFGPMNKVIVNSTSRLAEEDVSAMAVYLKSLPAKDMIKTKAPSVADLQYGEQVYSIHCATCHLPTGLVNEKGPPLAGSAIVLAPDAASLINVILYGAEVPEPEIDGAWESMEGFELKLDDEEVAALASYVRSSWGNTAGRVSVRQVAVQR